MTPHPVKRRKKLIEVAIPVEAINAALARVKSIRHGHPSTLHLWWARRPLAAARAVNFCQMVDDPSAVPEEFLTDVDQERERLRLFVLISKLVQWENTTEETVLEPAREEIRRSWHRCCADNADHPEVAELFIPEKLPGFHDPFAGGGALPVEAQRLGLEAYASDLNPVAVLINKAMIEIPPKFAGMPPVNPEACSKKQLIAREWKGTEGLAEDVRYYGKWMRDESEKRIGHFYPKMLIVPEMVNDPENPRPDLKPYEGQELTVIAWLWARTVKSPNPAFSQVEVPLASTFMLSTKAGREAYVQPVVDASGYYFTVKVGKPEDGAKTKDGTKLARGANFGCLMSGVPIEGDYIKSEGRAGRMRARLMAVVVEGKSGRVDLAPTPEHEAAALLAKPEWKPEQDLPYDPRNFWTVQYGFTTYGDLFTDRQLAEAVGVYLGTGVDKATDYNTSLVAWSPARDQAKGVINPDDSPMRVREALIEINAALDEHRSQDEGAFDADTRFALTFFESFGYSERPYGDVEGLAVTRNISVDSVAKAGILRSAAGKVQLYRRELLGNNWDPTSDNRLCVWEATQQLIKRLEADGEGGAAALLVQLRNLPAHGDLAANCRALPYRLYNYCEKTKQAEEARSYNGLVIAWPELERQASATSKAAGAPQQLVFT